jgi:hypothetical protein
VKDSRRLIHLGLFGSKAWISICQFCFVSSDCHFWLLPSLIDYASIFMEFFWQLHQNLEECWIKIHIQQHICEASKSCSKVRWNWLTNEQPFESPVSLCHQNLSW